MVKHRAFTERERERERDRERERERERVYSLSLLRHKPLLWNTVPRGGEGGEEGGERWGGGEEGEISSYSMTMQRDLGQSAHAKCRAVAVLKYQLHARKRDFIRNDAA
jgi:hypothetical protein